MFIEGVLRSYCVNVGKSKQEVPSLMFLEPFPRGALQSLQNASCEVFPRAHSAPPFSALWVRDGKKVYSPVN